MEKTVINKMTRYIELSEKFSKSEGDIFTREDLNGTVNGIGGGIPKFSNGIGGELSINSYSQFGGCATTVFIDGREIYIDDEGNVKAKDSSKPLTRGEQLKATEMAKTEVKAKLLDEYDEYIKLRTQLRGYVRGLDELTNGDK